MLDVQIGDVLTMKKNHPCGENRFLVLRVGMDFKIRCLGCGREVDVYKRQPTHNPSKRSDRNIPTKDT